METMNTVNPEVEFPKVEKMLMGLAQKYHRTYNIPLEECKSETYYAFAKAVKRYNTKRREGAEASNRSSFSTLCHVIANWRLKSLVLGRIQQPVFLEINEEIAGEAPPDKAPSLEVICDLSQDAKEIVSLLLDRPDWMRNVPCTNVTKLVSSAKEEFIWKRNASMERFNRAMAELRERFQSAWAV